MEKLFGTPAVLVIIYENLTFADQLRFAQVNSFLRSIFEEFIFPVKYAKLKITSLLATEKLLISNDKQKNCMLLAGDEVKNFLLVVADGVEQIHISSEVDEDAYIGELLHFFCVEACGNLENLTCLHYEEVPLSEKHLLMIADNCPKLSDLRLINCKNEATGEELMFERGLSISTLARMKNLKSLEVKGVSLAAIRMSLFCELITSVPLECLRLKATLKQDMHDRLILKRINHHLRQFEFEFDSESLEIFKGLGIFENLVKLNVKMLYGFTDSVFLTITKACENLECLTIGDDFIFRTYTYTIKDFQIPPNLKELFVSVELKSTHVIDMLTKFKIEKLNCELNGDPRLFKDLKMSPHIRVLNLKGVNTSQFPSFYANNNTLKELHWYEDSHLPGATQNRECLKTCKNLEYLVAYGICIPLNVILELKQLHKLEILKAYDQLSLSYIIGLLKHSSLKEFYIHDYNEVQDDASNVPAAGFPSSIALVHIEVEILESALDFWFDMLQHNPTMLIKCDIMQNYISPFLQKLIQHKNFPKDLREVKVWGFNLNCKDLRENFLATIDPINQINVWNWTNYTLVLGRKKNLQREN